MNIRRLNDVGNFRELVERIKARAHLNAAAMLDKMLLKGATAAEIVEKLKPEVRRRGLSVFNDVAKINTHLKLRERSGWVLERARNGKVKLVNYIKPRIKR